MIRRFRLATRVLLRGNAAMAEREASAYLAGVRDGLDGGIDMAVQAVRDRQILVVAS